MLASARAFVFYFNTERNAVYCVLYVFLFILYNTVFFITQPCSGASTFLDSPFWLLLSRKSREMSLDGFSIQGRRLQMEMGIDDYSICNPLGRVAGRCVQAQCARRLSSARIR